MTLLNGVINLWGDGILSQTKAAERSIRLGDLSEDISFLTRTVRAQMRGEVNRVRQDLDIEPGEIGILKMIKENPGISQGQLADTVVIKKSAVTHIVQTLLAKGFISRQRQVEDKRFKAIWLTEAGRAKLDIVNVKMNALHAQWFTGFSDQDRALLCALLLRLIENLGAETLHEFSADS